MDIQIAPELKQQLETLARERGTSVDELLRDLLARARQAAGANGSAPTEQSCYDLAQASGVVGVVGDAPPDLSTNPNHLDGFGRG